MAELVPIVLRTVANQVGVEYLEVGGGISSSRCLPRNWVLENEDREVQSQLDMALEWNEINNW